MDNGWVKLHRRIRNSVVYQHSTALHLWVECLLRASHDDRRALLKREVLDLKPGQFVLGYREIGKIAGCSASTAKYWLDFFESERMIERQANAKGTVVTVLNWVEYQNSERSLERQANAERTQQEGKELQEEKNYTVEKEILRWIGQFGTINNPTAWLRNLKSKAKDTAIAKSWREAKRGNGIESPADLYARALLHSSK